MSDLRFGIAGLICLLTTCWALASPAGACVQFDAVPLPVRFATSSARLEGLGKAAAEEMLAKIREKNPAEITLIGHSDSRGDAEYNLRLSERRAKAVADFLVENGVVARIEIVAKGKSDPIVVSAEGLARSDIWSLNRAVQWKYEPKPQPASADAPETRCIGS